MSTIRFVLAGLTFAAMSIAAHAHGPTPQKVEEKIEIAAPPEKVWGIIKDFAKISDWNPAVSKSEGTGGNENGATRTITLKTGELQEGLDYYSEKEMNVKPGAGGGSLVTWMARLYRADTGNEPAPDKNDAAAVKAMKAYLTEGLQGLKAKAEVK
jgi:mxaD protein